MNSKELKLESKKHGDKIVLLDESDYDYISQFRWHVRKDTHGFYAVRNGEYIKGARTPIIMHRVIMNAGKNQIVDHKDGNGLNNQRSNLRFCNPSQNAANRIQIKSNKSGYRGITLRPNGRYMVRVCFKNKRRSVGTFNTIDEAIKAYNNEAFKVHGEFAILIK